MKHFIYTTASYIMFTLGLILIIGSQITESEPAPLPQNEHRLPAEQNFQPEKIWTEDDFKQAETDPLDVSYHNPCQTSCPDNITADDLAIINAHHQKQMQRLVAGGK